MAKTIPPKGVRDFLPDELQQRQQLVHLLSSLYGDKGFLEVKTPLFEYYDHLVGSLGPGLESKSVVFTSASGQKMVLKADHTASIARMVSSRYTDAEMPIKLYYFDSVMRRYEKEGDVEFFQGGVEYIGEPGAEADAEVIALCIESLLQLGLEGVCVDIGHQQFLQEYTEKELASLKSGNYVELGYIPKRGGPEILEDDHPLVAVYDALKALGMANYVAFNKGQLCHMDYYTGMTFSVQVNGYGRSIASGGRYDNLLSKFGDSKPAVGFALKMNQVMRMNYGH